MKWNDIKRMREAALLFTFITILEGGKKEKTINIGSSRHAKSRVGLSV